MMTPAFASLAGSALVTQEPTPANADPLCPASSDRARGQVRSPERGDIFPCSFKSRNASATITSSQVSST